LGVALFRLSSNYCRKILGAVALYSLTSLSGGCFGGDGGDSVVKVEKIKNVKGKKKKEKNKKKKKSKKLPPEMCQVFEKIETDPPLYLEGKNIVVTQLMKPCVTREGDRGYHKKSPWMAMGFPCTGGGGKVSLIGNYYAPKVVSFIISTDCPMNPNSMALVREIAEQSIGLSSNMKLLSFNSFVVQFWEVPGLPDADTGFTIDLSSPAGKEGQWKRLRQKESMRIWLYGRENSWSSRDQFYKVEAEINLVGNRDFKLTIFAAKKLDKEEISEVKSRCETLRPRRNCGQVF
jgi:hypothetical protein